jgi:hypothetical protein
VGAREVVTWHAVEEATTIRMVRGAWRWRDLPLLLRRHPRMRAEFTLWGFYKRTHVWLLPAALGFVLMRRRRAYALLAVPYLVHATPRHHGSHARGRYRALLELPGRTAVDAAEMAALAWGSVKHRSPFL